MKSYKLFVFSAIWLAPFSELRAAPGDLNPFRADASGSSGNSVYVAVQDLNNLILAGGWFDSLGGATRLSLARLGWPGATLDNTFTPSTAGSASAVRSMAVLPDSRILIAGEFSFVSGQPRGRGAILNADGTVYAGFDPGLNENVYCTAVQPDGKMLFGGNFTSAFGVNRSRIVRVNANLTLDTGFNPVVNNTVRVMMEQPEGKLIIGGNFTTISGSLSNRLARLHPNGTVDVTFQPNFDGPVYAAVTLKDGKLLVGGSFNTVGGTARQNLVRLYPDGSVDTAFSTGADGIVRTMAVQVDGRIIVGGEFANIGGVARSRFARLDASGTVRADFSLGANGTVFSAALTESGSVILGGAFSRIGTTSRVNFASLGGDGGTFQSLTVPSPARVDWLRLGGAAEARYVTFDHSVSYNGPWTSLGTGTRTANGWEKTGLALPPEGYIRAQARVYASYGGGSSYLSESNKPYRFTQLQVWRQTYFGTLADEGDAASEADPDHDGLVNNIEFAFGLHPFTPDTEQLPQWQYDTNEWGMQFTAPESADGTAYLAEYNTTLGTGGWQMSPNLGEGRNLLFIVPQIPGSRMFLRLRVVTH